MKTIWVGCQEGMIAMERKVVRSRKRPEVNLSNKIDCIYEAVLTAMSLIACTAAMVSLLVR